MSTIDVPAGFASSPFQRLLRLVTSQQKLWTVLKSAVQIFAIRILGAGLTYASMILLARWLGAHDFGIYAYVLVIVTLLGIAFSFGFNSSGVRFVASYLARNRLRRLSGFLSFSHKVVAALALLGALAGAGLVFALKDTIEPYYVAPMLVGLLCVPVWALLNQMEATARAFCLVNVAYVPGYILRPLLMIVFVGGLVTFGGTADAVTALWALVGACTVAALGQGLVIWRRIRKPRSAARPAVHARHWFAVSLGFLMIDGFRMLLDNADILLIGRFLDPHSVAIYFAVIRTSGLITFICFSVIGLAVPKFAEIHSAGSRGELQRFVTNVTQLMFWPSLLAAGAMACAGPYLLSLFGAGFEAGYPAMLVVLTGLVLRSATLPVEYLLNMTGHHRDTLRVYAVAACANVILNLVLIPSFGIVGAAAGTYAAMLGGNLWLYRLVKKRLGVEASVFSLLKASRQPARA